MAFARVQATGKIRVDGGASISLTLGSAPVVGNALVVIVLASGTRNWAAGMCTDNRGNTYALASSRPGDFVNSPAIYFCSKLSTTGTPFIVTVSPAFGTIDLIASAVEFSGVGSGLEIHRATNSGGSGVAPNTGALPAVTIANTIDVAAMSIAAAQTAVTVDAGWTEELEELPASPYFPCEADTRINSVAPTTHVSWTCDGSGFWASARAMFNEIPFVPPTIIDGGTISPGVVTNLIQGKIYTLQRVVHLTTTSSVQVSMDGTTFSSLPFAETVGAYTSMRYLRSLNASCALIAKVVERLPLA
jgi:hypothetical protein